MAMLVITTSYHLMVAGAQHLRILRQAFGTRSQAIRIQKKTNTTSDHETLSTINYFSSTTNKKPRSS